MNESSVEYSENSTLAERFFLKSDRGAFLFAVATDEIVQKEFNATLRFRLLLNRKDIRIHDWQKDGNGLHPVEQLRSIKKRYPDTAGLLLTGLDAALDGNPDFLSQLNFGREALLALGIPMLFWLGSASLHRISFEAIDLYNQRAGSNLYFRERIEPVHPPPPSVLQERAQSDEKLRFFETRMKLLEQQLEEAERSHRNPAETAEEIVLELLSLYAEIPGKTSSIEKLLDRYHAGFDFEKPEQITVVADAFNALADAQKAGLLYKQALELYRKLDNDNPVAYRTAVAQALCKLAHFDSGKNEFAAAESGYREAVEIYRKLALAGSQASLADMAGALNSLATVQAARNELSAAEMTFQEALDTFRRLATIDPAIWLPEVSLTLGKLANIQAARNENRAAEKGSQEALKITGELANAFTWLHVSDFHLTDGAPYEQEVVLRSLVRSVKRFREEGYVPDLIFATGDIAHSGKVKEYEQATRFFDDLLEAAGQGRERLFIVPGNHDVDRRMGRGLARTLHTKEEADEFFDPALPTPHLTQKLGAFSAWYNAYFSNIRTFPLNTTCSPVETVTIRKGKVAVLCINSALFCCGDDDHEKLFIGRRCLDEAVKESAMLESDLNIALVHHPLHWLSPVEQANIRATLETSIDLLLQGHFHQAVTESIDSIDGGGYLKLAAGASYQTRQYPNSALYATHFQGEVTIFPIRYEDTPREEWTLDTSVFPSPLYTGRFALVDRMKSQSAKRAGSQRRESRLSPEHHKAEEQEKRYRSTLKVELGSIRMLGLPGVESVKVNLNDDTFVPLRLSGREQSGGYARETGVPGSVDEQISSPDRVMTAAFRVSRMLLVIGDPGAGKTTLLKYYALCALDGAHYSRLGFSAPVRVFYLPLRELGRKENGRYLSLPESLANWSERHHHTVEPHLFLEWLHDGASLVLLDGLDEISSREERITVCQWIDDAWSGFSKAFFVVTSRATGYRKDEGIELAADYERADVLDFTPEQQERFLKNWFTAAFLKDQHDGGTEAAEWQRVQRAKADDRTKKMVAYLGDTKNRGLRQLAAVPMILQIMAILWKNSDWLPDSRVRLYESALDYLLEFRDRRRNIPVLISAAYARKVLGPVSLWMQEELKKDEADKGSMQNQMQGRLEILRDKNYTPPPVEEFCTHLVKRAGLLVEYGSNAYVFRHKSFREYLAGVELLKKATASPGHFDSLISGFGDDWWEEPMRFFVAQGDEELFDLFMKKLFDSPVSDELTQKQQLLLQTLIEEAPEKKVDALCKKLLDPATSPGRQRVILDCLKGIGKGGALDALYRFRGGNLAVNNEVARRAEEVILALGGEAPASETVTLATGVAESFRNPNEQNAEYILIPGGRYIYSGTEKEVEVADLYVARYPVTNRQYRSFIAGLAGNKEIRDRLDEIAKKGEWDREFKAYLGSGKGDLAGLFRSRYDEDRKFGGDDQPVVGVSWYGAKAYSLWLSQLEGKAEVYRLPGEVEWEWAAGGRQGTTGLKVREYPWSDEKGEPTSKLANYDNNVGSTTPVGSYPDGATPEGLYDMAGNVWEWTESWWNEESRSLRVLRGGSWRNFARNCRSATRNLSTPDDRGSDVGFRLVFVPQSVGSSS